MWKPVQLQELAFSWAATRAPPCAFLRDDGDLCLYCLAFLPGVARTQHTDPMIIGWARKGKHEQEASHEPKLLLQPSKSLVNIERRLFMKKTLSLGALAMLTGCDPTDPPLPTASFRPCRAGTTRSSWRFSIPTSRPRFTPKPTSTRTFPSTAITRNQSTVWPKGLQARTLGPDRQEGKLDARAAPRPSAGIADHPPYLR